MIDGPTFRSWLVTGGTGSFGHAFVERLLADGADRIVVFSRDELKQAQMAAQFNDPRLRFMIGNVTDEARVERAMRGVDVVVHAAAMKRIETCEANPSEAVATNIQGTEAVAHAAIRAKVRRAVFLSTDKAAAPNTLYGATKLAAERLWTRANVYAAGRDTRLAATRYGNVLGSRGSVLELWKRQAETSGEVTVTDHRMTRFWMTIEQAVDLVLLAVREMQGGEVFIPKVPACGILTLAESVAPGVPWKMVGIRRGEKLHETLVSEDEARDTTDRGSHFCIEPERTWEDAPRSRVEGLPEGFAYRSDTNADQLTAERLREMCA